MKRPTSRASHPTGTKTSTSGMGKSLHTAGNGAPRLSKRLGKKGTQSPTIAVFTAAAENQASPAYSSGSLNR